MGPSERVDGRWQGFYVGRRVRIPAMLNSSSDDDKNGAIVGYEPTTSARDSFVSSSTQASCGALCCIGRSSRCTCYGRTSSRRQMIARIQFQMHANSPEHILPFWAMKEFGTHFEASRLRRLAHLMAKRKPQATCLYSDIESHEYSRHQEPPVKTQPRLRSTDGREAITALLRVQSVMHLTCTCVVLLPATLLGWAAVAVPVVMPGMATTGAQIAMSSVLASLVTLATGVHFFLAWLQLRTSDPDRMALRVAESAPVDVGARLSLARVAQISRWAKRARGKARGKLTTMCSTSAGGDAFAEQDDQSIWDTMSHGSWRSSDERHDAAKELALINSLTRARMNHINSQVPAVPALILGDAARDAARNDAWTALPPVRAEISRISSRASSRASSRDISRANSGTTTPTGAFPGLLPVLPGRLGGRAGSGTATPTGFQVRPASGSATPTGFQVWPASGSATPTGFQALLACPTVRETDDQSSSVSSGVVVGFGSGPKRLSGLGAERKAMAAVRWKATEEMRAEEVNAAEMAAEERAVAEMEAEDLEAAVAFEETVLRSSPHPYSHDEAVLQSSPLPFKRGADLVKFEEQEEHSPEKQRRLHAVPADEESAAEAERVLLANLRASYSAKAVEAAGERAAVERAAAERAAAERAAEVKAVAEKPRTVMSALGLPDLPKFGEDRERWLADQAVKKAAAEAAAKAVAEAEATGPTRRPRAEAAVPLPTPLKTAAVHSSALPVLPEAKEEAAAAAAAAAAATLIKSYGFERPRAVKAVSKLDDETDVELAVNGLLDRGEDPRRKVERAAAERAAAEEKVREVSPRRQRAAAERAAAERAAAERAAAEERVEDEKALSQLLLAEQDLLAAYRADRVKNPERADDARAKLATVQAALERMPSD